MNHITPNHWSRERLKDGDSVYLIDEGELIDGGGGLPTLKKADIHNSEGRIDVLCMLGSLILDDGAKVGLSLPPSEVFTSSEAEELIMEHDPSLLLSISDLDEALKDRGINTKIVKILSQAILQRNMDELDTVA
jgi:hypothetical protein